MKAETRRFGTIEIEDEKIIRMEKGMIGLPDFKNFALIFDEEKGFENTKIMWLQSMDDGETAFPVMNPVLLFIYGILPIALVKYVTAPHSTFFIK